MQADLLLQGGAPRAAPQRRAALAALTITMLLTALVLGVFIPIVQATTGTANEVRSRVVVDVFVEGRRPTLSGARCERRSPRSRT